MALAVVVTLLVIGSLVFHFVSPWWFTPLASNWSAIDDTIILTFWVTGIVFVAINLFLAWCVYRYRYKEGQKASYEPENSRLEIWLTGITTVGVIAMLAPGLIVWAEFVQVPDNAVEVEVIGQQWHWSYRYPGDDGEFGDVDPTLISVGNPFGMDPTDERGQDDILVANPQMHLQIDQPVKILMRSKDVLHNFSVAEFRVKMDMVPGMLTYMWLTPTLEGSYDVLCEELCGMAHHAMRGKVVVEGKDAYEAWIASQPTYAEILAATPGDAVAGKTAYGPCAGCHGQNGEGNLAMNSPKLSGIDDWYLRRQLNNYKLVTRGTDPSDVFGAQMRGMVATLFNDKAINDVVAYIGTLPDTPAEPTISGNISNGKKLYETCVNCHGAEGQGIWAMNAPRIAGISDWYTANQLRNFRDGLRGAHPQDFYGQQMAQMAQMLNEEHEINDVIAYMNTLGASFGEQQVAGIETTETFK